MKNKKKRRSKEDIQKMLDQQTPDLKAAENTLAGLLQPRPPKKKS